MVMSLRLYIILGPISLFLHIISVLHSQTYGAIFRDLPHEESSELEEGKRNHVARGKATTQDAWLDTLMSFLRAAVSSTWGFNRPASVFQAHCPKYYIDIFRRLLNFGEFRQVRVVRIGGSLNP